MRNAIPTFARFYTVAIASLLVLTTQPAACAEPVPNAPPSAAPASEVRFVDFPRAIDPSGRHKHVQMFLGSRLYARPAFVARQVILHDGQPYEQAFILDAGSSITRGDHETLIVEPDGHEWHLSAATQIERGNFFKRIVILPGQPVPVYLQNVKPDPEVR
jgi:hypothetical protein